MPKSVWDRVADHFDPPEHELRTKPAEWIDKRLGEFIYSKQIEIVESAVQHRYTAVPSCHDSGKSYIASRLAGWWLDVHPVGKAFVVTTAPTTPQVEAILWREISGMHEDHNLPGRTTLDAKWYIGSRLVAFGRKPADYADPTRAAAHFQGIHATYVLILIDEAGGVPKWLFDAVDTLATNTHARVAAIGNPDDPQSHFATICQPGSGWNVIHIDAYDTPNFTGEQVPPELREQLISKEWVKEREKRWGIGSPMFESKVRGRFPKVSDDMLIQPGWILAAQQRFDNPKSPNRTPDLTDSSYGVDVARKGSNETVIYLRSGGRITLVEQGTGWETTKTAGKLNLHVRAHPARPQVNVDDSGVGGGVTDILIEEELEVLPLNGGGAASEGDLLPNGKKRFINARSEWFWNLRKAFEAGAIDIDPQDEDLAAQLQALKWGVNRHGQIWIESKEDMEARGIPSPDRADGVCYAWVRRGGLVLPAADKERQQAITSDLESVGF